MCYISVHGLFGYGIRILDAYGTDYAPFHELFENMWIDFVYICFLIPVQNECKYAYTFGLLIG